MTNLSDEVLRMFRRGFDTASIARLLRVSEPEAVRWLHQALSHDRYAKRTASASSRPEVHP